MEIDTSINSQLKLGNDVLVQRKGKGTIALETNKGTRKHPRCVACSGFGGKFVKCWTTYREWICSAL